jgi:opine dehydrogenase
MNVLVLGGGNAAYATAADLVLRGHAVKIHSERPQELEPIHDVGGIEITGEISGFARIEGARVSLAEALDWAEIGVLNVSAGGFECYAEAVARNVRKDQTIVSFGKGGASLILNRVAREAGLPIRLTLADGNKALYVCRRTEGAQVWVPRVWKSVTVAAFPGRETVDILSRLSCLFPNTNFVGAAHVLEVILLDYNPVMHPGPMICNASRVESASPEFRLFAEENMTPAVVNVVESLDHERLHLCKAVGVDAMPFNEECHRLGLVPKGTPLAECLRIELLTQLPGPFSLRARHLSEDVPFGLAAWCAIGEMVGVPMPLAHACCALASTLNQEDYLTTGASLSGFGMDPSWTVDRLKTFLVEGHV